MACCRDAPDPSIRPNGQPISFLFNNQRLPALQGETIAAALSASGITTFRHTPSGAPRGLFCGMGACFDCIAAAASGAHVILLDERRTTGGQFAKALAPSHTDNAPDARFRFASSLRNSARQAGVQIETDATVWGAFAPDEIAAVVRGQAITYGPRRLILATGAHESPVPIPGWTLPGVMTTGGLQTLVRTPARSSR